MTDLFKNKWAHSITFPYYVTTSLMLLPPPESSGWYYYYYSFNLYIQNASNVYYCF